ncbi:MAG: FAD-dependent oxidoreductase [Burkholderiales bacterium]|nr:FAD-dependent oxidoreductase [Burkholderiales bacterium]
MNSVAVLGAGWSGLAAAVELTAAGFKVDVFEAARQPGGRARRVDLDGHALDNGQHILLGAYRETLRLIAATGADPERLLRRRPLELLIPGQLLLRAPRRLPAPLHLLTALMTARGIGFAGKRAALRLMASLAWRRYRADPGQSVAALLRDHRQPTDVSRLVWEPLCVAALNTAPESASAQVFVNVLRDAFAHARRDSDLLLPAGHLGALFPDPACAHLRSAGANLHFGCPAGAVRAIDGQVRVVSRLGETTHSAVVCALPPARTADVLPRDDARLGPLREALAAIRYEPIVTCYLQYPPAARLPAPMLGLVGGVGQWAFDKGVLGGPAGMIAVVVSAAGRLRGLPPEKLAATLDAELRAALPGLQPLQRHRVISDKRATFRCSPALARPQTATPLPGVFLAGDHVDNGYPATLEGAVRNGVSAAQAVARWTRRPAANADRDARLPTG